MRHAAFDWGRNQGVLRVGVEYAGERIRGNGNGLPPRD